MIEVVTMTKEWGNSIGIILPKKCGLKLNQEVRVCVQSTKRFTKVKDIFGTLKLKNIKELMQEIDNDLR